MSLRIEKRKNSPQIADDNTIKFQDYLGRLVKMIPGEIVGLYMIGSGYIDPKAASLSCIWIGFCLIMVIVVRSIATKDITTGKPQVVAVLISTTAFLIWVYWMGGPFNVYIKESKQIASLLVLACTFIVPAFYKGD